MMMMIADHPTVFPKLFSTLLFLVLGFGKMTSHDDPPKPSYP